MSNAYQDELEKIIDSTSVAKVLDMIATICRLKAAHIRDNWQDAPLSRRWVAAATVLEKAESNPKVKKVSG